LDPEAERKSTNQAKAGAVPGKKHLCEKGDRIDQREEVTKGSPIIEERRPTNNAYVETPRKPEFKTPVKSTLP